VRRRSGEEAPVLSGESRAPAATQVRSGRGTASRLKRMPTDVARVLNRIGASVCYFRGGADPWADPLSAADALVGIGAFSWG
jgi:hypothetical protein